MKPCFSKRKLIVWLTLDELDARRAQDLRAHLETCAGCRRYLEEISAVGQRLAVAETTPEIAASESFHRQLVSRLRPEQSESPWEVFAERLSALRLTWRVALPVMGTVALAILMLALFPRQPGIAPPVQISRPVVAPQASMANLLPTVANYQRAASRSLDELDELLTRQAKRTTSLTPIYTASIFLLAHAPE